ncbi:MAG: 4-hydroxy-tetrahydrodipicolinate synthase [Alphaproteobacteria bacterium]|nr:4-hydroxy-tetrahydrodipicolinate synthase [Alphaproteobacteria bacterium]
MFSGSIVALITPFSENAIDEAALARLVRFHLDNGTKALVPVGTTGEAPTLARREHERVIEVVVQEAGGQVPVIAGAGSYDAAQAISHTNHAAAAGADAALHVMGYYNRPNQEGIYQHFKALDAATELPLIVYNIPPRAVIDILPETMARLASLPNVVGVKDSTCDLSRPLKEKLLIEGDFCFLTGEDQTAVAYNANGGQGCISVTANVAPALCAQMQDACARKKFQLARDIQLKLMPLHQALFLEPSPAGVKYACSLLGLCEPKCRLPMVDLTETTKAAIKEAMRGLELL